MDRKYRILVIEDEIDEFLRIKRALKKELFEITRASTYERGLEIINELDENEEEKSFDFGIFDLSLRTNEAGLNMGGLELAKKVSSRDYAFPIYIVTNHYKNQMAQKVVEALEELPNIKYFTKHHLDIQGLAVQIEHEIKDFFDEFIIIKSGRKLGIKETKGEIAYRFFDCNEIFYVEAWSRYTQGNNRIHGVRFHFTDRNSIELGQTLSQIAPKIRSIWKNFTRVGPRRKYLVNMDLIHQLRNKTLVLKKGNTEKRIDLMKRDIDRLRENNLIV